MRCLVLVSEEYYIALYIVVREIYGQQDEASCLRKLCAETSSLRNAYSELRRVYANEGVRDAVLVASLPSL